MATSTATADFFDDFKDYSEAVLVGSLAFGSAIPLVLKTISDHYPGIHSSIPNQVWLFYWAYALYFVLPIVLGLLAWWAVKKNSPDDMVFVDGFLDKKRLTRRQYRLLRWGPLLVLGVLTALGMFIMWPRGGWYHGPAFMKGLLWAYFLLTAGLVIGGMAFHLTFVKIPASNTFRRRAVQGIWTQWVLGVALAGVLFWLVSWSFFEEHEKQDLIPSNASNAEKPKPDPDSALTIQMPFQWQLTARLIDSVYVKNIDNSFRHVTEQANLVAAASLDYNDIVLRQQPDMAHWWKLAPKIPLPCARVLRDQLIKAYEEADCLGNEKYVGSESLDLLVRLDSTSAALDSFRRRYDVLAAFPNPDGSAEADTLRLLLANQLMPLADNLGEAAVSIRAMARKHSRMLLAEWVKITRFKGLFLLFCYLNILLFAWFVMRLAYEVCLSVPDEVGAPRKRVAPTNPAATEGQKPPQKYRELTYLRYFLALALLLILPLFRTVDENTVSADQPFWFLNLPELIGDVVQPLPDGYGSGANHAKNQEMMDRIGEINTHVERLEKDAEDLKKSLDGIDRNIEQLKYQ